MHLATKLRRKALDWMETRSYRVLWRSLPALLVGVAWVLFGLTWRNWSAAGMDSRYSTTAVRALAAKDFPTARVACLRLLSAGNTSREEHIFLLALATQGLGRTQEATKLLQLAAPLAKPGYAPAHLHVARLLLNGTNATPHTVRAGEIHLKHVLTLEPTSAEANEILGLLYYKRGDWDLAKKHLATAASTKPNFALLLAGIAKDEGDKDLARAWAERAVRPFRDRVKDAKVDRLEDRMVWVQGLVLLEQYAEAMRVLEAGRKQSDNPAYGPALGSVCAAWAKTLAKDQPEDLTNRIALIQRGLEAAPRNPNLLRLLLDLTRLKGAEADAARETMSKKLSEGSTSAILHFMLGSDAWQRGEAEAARQHLRLAFDTAPNMPIIANNMAAMLITGTPDDLPKALDIIQPVAEKYPTNPYFRDTRGIILAKLGRWEEAIKDLEFSLPQVPSKGATHEALALAYRGLGLADMAARHEKLSKQLSADKKTSLDPEPVPAPVRPE